MKRKHQWQTVFKFGPGKIYLMDRFVGGSDGVKIAYIHDGKQYHKRRRTRSMKGK